MSKEIPVSRSFPRFFGQSANAPEKFYATLAVFGLWLGCVLAGWVGLAWNSSRPGNDSEPPLEWPASSTLARNPKLPTLVMFVHPKFPFTETSVAELARIMEARPQRMTAKVVFVPPESGGENGSHTRLWEAAGSIPGVQRIVDVGDREARRFRASAAGRTLLYGASGELLFASGITPARGHRGGNPSETAIVALLQARQAQTRGMPAFGCPLFNLPAAPR